MCYQTDLENQQEQIKAFVFSRIMNPTDALDVIQDINRVIIEKEIDFDESRNFSAWAMGIARFQILAYLTKMKRNKNISFEKLLEGELQEKNGIVDAKHCDLNAFSNDLWLTDIPLDNIIQKEINNLTIKVMSHLTPEQRKVFKLLCKGYSPSQISEGLNMPYVSVTSHKRRLIARAKKYLRSLHLINKYDYRSN